MRWQNGQFVIVSVAEGSPSARASIRKGDEVLSIDGRKPGSASLLVLGRLLCGDGRTVRIVVRRGEQVCEVPLRLDTSWQAAKSERRQTQRVRASD
jgi:S1-C subfamily serine protease